MSRKKINDGLEGRILAVLQLKYSQPQIVKILKKDGINVSQQTVSNIKRNIGLQRNSVEKIKFSQQRPVATPSTVSKVIQAIDVNDPPTQRSIAKSCYAIHKLTPSNAEKRRRRAPRLYRQLANNRYKKFITTDESWFYLDGTEGKRKVCYIKKSDPDYEKMILQQDSSRPQGFLVWAGISSYAKTSLRFVKPGVKINSDYYINNILKPFLSRDVPRLF
ncbi:unnamed protein product [Rotaria socialis]|uniref:Transposase n=1 Tax=Rotaria socialis TaxID=392032 RepID=A0A818SJF2_9BILA|nr:unnamed protein product [Rotaria socialis]CAF3673514.1 unnamed protein product [Rotaria socialis]